MIVDFKIQIERWYPTVAKYWHLFHPRTYRAITWACVTVGLGIAGGPLWLPIVEALTNKYLQIEAKLTSPPWFGLIILLVGLAFAVVNNWVLSSEDAEIRAARERQRDHDKTILKDVFSLLDERFINHFVDGLLGDNSYSTADTHRLQRLFYSLADVSTDALDEEIQASLSSLREATGVLLKFLAYNFFVYPESQRDTPLRLVLQPRLNCDRQGSGRPEEDLKYQEYQSELDRHVHDFVQAFNSLVRMSKSKFPDKFFELLGGEAAK